MEQTLLKQGGSLEKAVRISNARDVHGFSSGWLALRITRVR